MMYVVVLGESLGNCGGGRDYTYQDKNMCDENTCLSGAIFSR